MTSYANDVNTLVPFTLVLAVVSVHIAVLVGAQMACNLLLNPIWVRPLFTASPRHPDCVTARLNLTEQSNIELTQPPHILTCP